MELNQSKFSFSGLLLSAIAFLFVLIHFYAGPIDKKDNIENFVVEKKITIKKKMAAAIKGEDYRSIGQKTSFNADKFLTIASAIIAAIIQSISL